MIHPATPTYEAGREQLKRLSAAYATAETAGDEATITALRQEIRVLMTPRRDPIPAGERSARRAVRQSQRVSHH